MMQARRIVAGGGLLLAAGVALGGCAGPQRQALGRLQSQVGFLDERVSQLERGSGAALPAWTGAAPTAGGGEAAAPSAPPSSPSPRAPGRIAMGKPSTRQVQQALKNAGFYQGSVDGKSGPITKQAVREFQRVHGLKEDGVVGRQTWVKLNAYTELSAVSGALESSPAEPPK